MTLKSDPDHQTPEQREGELRAAGWVWALVKFPLTYRWLWQAPDGVRTFESADAAYRVMLAERDKQQQDLARVDSQS